MTARNSKPTSTREFLSDSMSVHTAGSRGIYAEDAGLTLDTYCDGNHVSGCVCQESYADSCSFSGFTTSVDVNTTGNQYPVVINQVRFSNNETDVRINGINYATVTRCDFDLQVAPSMAGSRCGRGQTSTKAAVLCQNSLLPNQKRTKSWKMWQKRLRTFCFDTKNPYLCALEGQSGQGLISLATPCPGKAVRGPQEPGMRARSPAYNQTLPESFFLGDTFRCMRRSFESF